MKSLYITPQKTEKKPIRKKKYRNANTLCISGTFLSRPENSIKIDAKPIKHAPCPISPYITPKRNGNVTIKVRPGLASL